MLDKSNLPLCVRHSLTYPIMHRILAPVLLLTLVLPHVAFGQSAPTKPKKQPVNLVDEMAKDIEPARKIVYKTAGGQQLLLHVFLPKDFKPEDKRTCFLLLHGGGWTGGDPRRMYPYADHFARRGMVAVSAQYRLMNKKRGITVFDCVKDGRSAVRYLRGHAAELGIDPDKIVVAGASAGGHVAAGTALFDGVDEQGESTDVSCVPNALILLYAVLDTSTDGYGNAKIGARWQELSPLDHVRANLPPTLVFHGTGDTLTPFAGCKTFCDKMIKAGNRCELVVHEGGRHGYFLFNQRQYENVLAKIEAIFASLGF